MPQLNRLRWCRKLKQERKVGRRGQVTIPKAMRDALKLEPGSEVYFALEGDKLVVRRWFDAVAVFERAAHEINCNKKIDPHAAHDEELEERYRRTIVEPKEKEKKGSNSPQLF